MFPVLEFDCSMFLCVCVQMFRCTENFTIYGSVVVLVEIAFDRYFKICRPLMVIRLFTIKVPHA